MTPPRARVLRWTLASALLWLALLACREVPEPHPEAPQLPAATNLLMLVSDTLRADALSCYGGEAVTPAICSLAERGTLFEVAYSAAPWTLPSAVTLFTGAPPGRYQRPGDPGRGTENLYRVPGQEVLLAEVLAERGWLVQRRVENGVAAQGNSLQGFADTRYSAARAREARARWGRELAFEAEDPRYDRVWWLLERLLESPEPQQPFFYLHWLQDPHAAYRPPDHLQRRLEFGPRRLPQDLDFYLGLGHRNRPEKGRRKIREVGPDLSPAELELVRDLYLREVESVDERVGAILSALERSGRLDDTLVLFTSDHGEALGEHGNFLHGVSLQEELVRIPILLAGPGVPPGTRVRTPVAHRDVVPTLAAAVGVAQSALTTADGGRDLRELANSPELQPPMAVHLSSPDRLQEEAIVLGDLKLIARSDQSVSLYDLAQDPGEAQDLASSRPEETERLLQLLRRARADSRPVVRGDEDAAELERAARETEQELRAIGYID